VKNYNQIGMSGETFIRKAKKQSGGEVSGLEHVQNRNGL